MTSRVRIVDDHELLAQSLSYALQARGFDATPLVVINLEAARAELLADPPDVVLLDLQLGAAGHGLCLVRPLTEAGSRVLVVSGVTDQRDIAATVEAGAVGFVSKSKPIDVLLEAATAVLRGEKVMTDDARHQLLDQLRRHRAESRACRRPFDDLTTREREVLRGLCDGESVTTIATRCVVSVATVRTQVRAILLKLGVGSQLEAVALAHRHHWYDHADPGRRSA